MPAARPKDAGSKATSAAPTPPAGRPLIGVNTDYVTPKNGLPYTRLNAGYGEAAEWNDSE